MTETVADCPEVSPETTNAWLVKVGVWVATEPAVEVARNL